MTDKATKRPWVAYSDRSTINIDGPDRMPVALMASTCRSEEEALANRDLIVRAVNAHDALVEACEAALAELNIIPDNWRVCDKIIAALDAARGE